ncbi:MAG: hypothetical protein ABIP51_13815, partial [Bacteroidia bacterium]
MMRLFFAFYFLAHVSFAQITTVHQCKYRFDNYLNFKGSLNHRVEFQKEVIYIKNATGKKILAIYAAEIPMLAKFFTNTSFSKQEKLLKFKGLKILKAPQRDSILAKVNDKRANLYKLKGLPLSGYRVAIDPGHSATTLSEAEIEQKFLYFVKDSINHPNDSIKLFESVLTFNTAQLLQKMLEEQGAKVMITRSQNNFSSFNCTYTTW